MQTSRFRDAFVVTERSWSCKAVCGGYCYLHVVITVTVILNTNNDNGHHTEHHKEVTLIMYVSFARNSSKEFRNMTVPSKFAQLLVSEKAEIQNLSRDGKPRPLPPPPMLQIRSKSTIQAFNAHTIYTFLLMMCFAFPVVSSFRL